MKTFETTPEERAAAGYPGQVFAEHSERLAPTLKKVEFAGGRSSYELIGPKNPDRNPYLYIPGFAGSYTGVEGLARELSAGEDEVIVAGQPQRKKVDRLKSGSVFSHEDIIDLHADAILAIIEDQGLTHQPIDVACHSLGLMILERAAQKAKQKGYTCFDSEQGAHSYAITPAGLVSDEKLRRMAGRYVKFIVHDGKTAKKYDADRKIAIANSKVLLKQPAKTAGEVNALRGQVDVDKLGELGLKPFVLVMGDDLMYPYKEANPDKPRGEAGTVIDEAQKLYKPSDAAREALKSGDYDSEALEVNDEPNTDPVFAGVASPVDNSYRTAQDFQTFKERFEPEIAAANPGIDEKELKKKLDEAWLDANSNAGHGDVSYHPKRIASAIRQIRNLQYNQHRLHG